MAEELGDKDFVYSRLHETVCFWDGKPVYVYVSKQDANDIVRIRSLGIIAEELRQVSYLSYKFDYSKYKLGYYNSVVHGALYVKRLPLRRWKQGLSSGCLIASGGRNIQKKDMDTGAFSKMLKNEYPSLAKCILQSRKNRYPVAFHRNFAINVVDGNKCHLHYKGDIVGTCEYDKDDNDKLDVNIQSSMPYTVIHEILNNQIKEFVNAC